MKEAYSFGGFFFKIKLLIFLGILYNNNLNGWGVPGFTFNINIAESRVYDCLFQWNTCMKEISYKSLFFYGFFFSGVGVPMLLMKEINLECLGTIKPTYKIYA